MCGILCILQWHLFTGCFYTQWHQRCAGAEIQESTPAEVSAGTDQDQEWIFLGETGPGAGVIF